MCGSEHNVGKSYVTAFECAKKCRTIYSNEKYFEWGFIGGGRATECIWGIFFHLDGQLI